MNICSECQHVVRREVETPRRWCDYNWRCGAVEPILTRDPVTGIAGFMVKNDLGPVGYSADKEGALPQCRTVNPNGECAMFAARGGAQ